jgi:hypothetical protein
MALEQNPKPCSNPRPLGLMAPNKTPGLVHQWHHSHLTWWLMPAGGPKALLWHHSTELGLAARVAIEPGCDPTSGQLCAGGLPDCPAPAAQAAHSMHTMTHHCTSWYSMAQHCTALHSRDSMQGLPCMGQHGTAWTAWHSMQGPPGMGQSPHRAWVTWWLVGLLLATCTGCQAEHTQHPKHSIMVTAQQPQQSDLLVS